MSGSERSIIIFANLVVADNFHGAREALEGADKEDKIMMKAVLMKASAGGSVSSGMQEFMESVIGN